MVINIILIILCCIANLFAGYVFYQCFIISSFMPGLLRIILLGCLLGTWIILIGLTVGLFHQTYLSIYRASLSYTGHNTEAEVTEKEYTASHTYWMMVGKVMVPNTISETFSVYVTCENNQYVLYGKELYEKVEKGDMIKVTVYNGYDKNGNIGYTYLSAF